MNCKYCGNDVGGISRKKVFCSTIHRVYYWRLRKLDGAELDEHLDRIRKYIGGVVTEETKEPEVPNITIKFE